MAQLIKALCRVGIRIVKMARVVKIEITEEAYVIIEPVYSVLTDINY